MPPPVIPDPKPSETIPLDNASGVPGAITPQDQPALDKKQPEKLTASQEEVLKQFSTAYLARDGDALMPAKPKTQKKSDKKESEKPNTATPAKPKPASKPKPVAKVPPAPQPLTTDQIAEAAARGVATAMKPGDKGTEKAPATEPELPAEEQEKITVLQQMEKQFGDKYKGLANKYSASYQKLADYAKKWEADHPGETFDNDAEEHKAFFEANDVEWEDNDYVKAMVKLSTDIALEAERRKTNEKLTDLERRNKVHESAPQIGAEQIKADRNYWTALDPEFTDIIDEKGVVNHAKLAELAKSDPVAHQIRIANVNDLRVETSVLYTVMNGLVKFDPKNPVHAAMSAFAAEAEQKLAAMPADEQLDEKGRSFLTADQYYKKSKAERESLNWTFNSTDLAAIRAADLANEAREKIAVEEKKLQEWAAARGLKPAQPAPEKLGQAAQTPPAELEEEPPPNPNKKPSSPSAASESRAAALAGGKGKPDAGSKFAQRMIHGTNPGS